MPAKRPGGARVSYREADRKLFPQMAELTQQYHGSVIDAAIHLVCAGKVAGTGTALSKARRLAQRFQDARQQRVRPARSNPELREKLLSQMRVLVGKHHGDAFAAALELARAGKVPGKGRIRSKAIYLATRFNDSLSPIRRRPVGYLSKTKQAP